MTKHNTKTQLLPSSAIMAQLGYSNRAAFLEFIRREGLPFYRMGPRRFMFNQQEVESWLARHRVGGAT